MENHERVERELLEQCGQVATLFRVAATTSASSGSKNFVVPSVRALLLDIDNPWWRGSRDLRVQNRNWSDVSCPLVVGTRVTNTRVATSNLSSGERLMPRLKAVY
ncbi:hypothetical protein ALC57_16660 [Trachymyrmex cornetzi]|uniref:Uncharacterized protein n=1 Tax=Trachymyrmex cornetzi TaxID=471704 RepID=A0A151IUQ6_9HYME|nr:hypothetical protein ALC57_16660 [Trachymyrmex cornetzi]